MSRIALGNAQVFRELVRKTAPIITVSEEQLYNIILTQWWTKVRAAINTHSSRSIEPPLSIFQV